MNKLQWLKLISDGLIKQLIVAAAQQVENILHQIIIKVSADFADATFC